MSNLLGLGFAIVFAALITGMWLLYRRRAQAPLLREIEGYQELPYRVGYAVEAGQRLHVSLGSGGIGGPDTAASLAGLAVLNRLAGAASISDQPPVVTAGDGAAMILAQDTLRRIYRRQHALDRYDHSAGRMTGATPFSYAAGAMMVHRDEKVATSLVMGRLGPELALITSAGERAGVHQIAGTDDPQAQALPLVTANHALIGEDMFAAGAYIAGGDPLHVASLQAQDWMRLLVAGVIIVGAVLRALGII
ncbi:MAG: DUF6754 domain-containing protein [Anaerolineales bacterium]